MNSLIEALGLDVRILLAQFVNFAILIFVLWRFAYKPVLKILEDRRLKIEQGIKDSETAEQKLALAVQDSKKIIAEARQEASAIIEEAQGKGEAKYQEVVLKAKEDLRLIMDKEKEKLQQEKQNLVNQVKSEASDLIVKSLEKFLGDNMNEDGDKRLIEKIIKELS